jgi:hypothetical protein
MSAVVPRRLSRAFTSAPASTRSLIAAGFPFRAANITIVSPLGPRSFASAPALSSLSIIGALP